MDFDIFIYEFGVLFFGVLVGFVIGCYIEMEIMGIDFLVYVRFFFWFWIWL